MRIEIENPPVEFVVNGETKVSFDFFELEQQITDSYKAERASIDGSVDSTRLIKEWMHSKGLPDNINEATVDSWLNAYMKAVEDEKKNDWAIELACLYGPEVLLLPCELQRILYTGRSQAIAYKQANYWDTTRERTKEAVQDVYGKIRSPEEAASIASQIARAEKEAEAEARLRSEE